WRPKARTGAPALCAVGHRPGRGRRHNPLRAGRGLGCRADTRAASAMSAPLIGAAGIASLLLLLFLRVPVWAALTLVGFVGNLILSGAQGAFTLAGTAPFDVASAYTLSVISLFVLLGEVASNTRLSADLFNAARVMLSGIRGGLAIATIAASARFGAVCGSSIVT